MILMTPSQSALPTVDAQPDVMQAEAALAAVAQRHDGPRRRLAELVTTLAGMRRSHRDYPALAAERAALEQDQPARDRELAAARQTVEDARAAASMRLAAEVRPTRHAHLRRIAQAVSELALAVLADDAHVNALRERGIDRGLDAVPIPRHLGSPDNPDAFITQLLLRYAEAGIECPSPLAVVARALDARETFRPRPAA